MNTVDVRVINTDDNEKYLYPSRSVEIRVSSSNRIITPTRAVTDYEFNQKALIPTEMPIENQVYISVADLNWGEFQKFMHVNGYYAKVISTMELKSRLSQYSNLRLFLLKPTITDTVDEETGKINYAPMKLLEQNPALLERFIRVIIQMQNEVGVNPVTIPFLELPLEQYKEIIRDVYLSLGKIGKQPVFFIDMRYQHFQPIVDLLTKEYQSNLIGLYFRKYREANLNYDYLRDYAKKDVAFLATLVDRSSLYDISTMHYLPFLGNDIYAVKRTPGFAKYVKDENGYVRDETGKKIVAPVEYTAKNIAFFDKENLCIENINKNPKLVQLFLAEYRNDDFITALLKNRNNVEGKKRDCDALKAFSKVSELISSQSEFISFQDYVKQDSSADYIDDRAVLKQTLSEIAKL